jgi:uncharacterized protein YeaO (DUF488 family)
MTIKLKSLSDSVEQPKDGLRILVTQYVPRGVKKEDQSWHMWTRRLAPSVELHRIYMKLKAIDWNEYQKRFALEMKNEKAVELIRWLSRLMTDDKLNVTLLCFCEDEERCHRSLIKAMIERQHSIDMSAR